MFSMVLLLARLCVNKLGAEKAIEVPTNTLGARTSCATHRARRTWLQRRQRMSRYIDALYFGNEGLQYSHQKNKHVTCLFHYVPFHFPKNAGKIKSTDKQDKRQCLRMLGRNAIRQNTTELNVSNKTASPCGEIWRIISKWAHKWSAHMCCLHMHKRGSKQRGTKWLWHKTFLSVGILEWQWPENKS